MCRDRRRGHAGGKGRLGGEAKVMRLPSGSRDLRQGRIVALIVVAECDPQPVEPAALGGEVGDIQKIAPRVAMSLLLDSISPPSSDSSQCSSVGIGR